MEVLDLYLQTKSNPRCIHFYETGKKYNFNMCCIRFFIKKCLLNYIPAEPYIGMSTGVIFCPQCSENMDSEILKIIFNLTSESDDEPTYFYHHKAKCSTFNL